MAGQVRLAAVWAGVGLMVGGLMVGALTACKPVGILRQIDIVIEIGHYRDHAADRNENRAARVEAWVRASGNCEVETSRHDAQYEHRGLLRS